MKILGICGSLQAGSSNLALLETAAALMPPGATVELFDGLRHLPHFDPDLDARGATPEVLAWRAALASADAVLIACPEYGHSLPGSVKNAIDWVIRSGELSQKLVAITAAVPHRDRGRRGLAALATTLAAVDARVLGGEPILKGEAGRAELAALVEALIERLRADHG